MFALRERLCYDGTVARLRAAGRIVAPLSAYWVAFSQGGIDGGASHDREATAHPRGDPELHERARLPAVGAGDRRAGRALVVVHGAVAPQDARAPRPPAARS